MEYENLCIAEFDAAIREEKASIWQELTQLKKDNPILPDNAIIDMNQTVAWNREEVQRCNRSTRAKIGAIKRRLNQVDEKAKEEIIRRIKEDSGFGDNISSFIYERAYDQSHSEGYAEVCLTALDLANFVEQVLDLTT